MPEYEIIIVNDRKVYKFVNSNGTTDYQEAPYIEDGWQICEDKLGFFNLYEIPQYGGEPMLEDQYNTLEEAHKVGISWC
jgi:hypothetical protein